MKTLILMRQLALLVAFVIFSNNITAQVQSKKANDFINSIGVATHFDRTTGPYSNATNVKTQLQNIGIKHVRDQIRESNFTNYNTIKYLSDNGIKMTGFLQGDFNNSSLTPAWWIQHVKNSGAIDAYEAFEGANESDLGMGFTYKGQTWPAGTKAFQIDLFNTVKNDASISNRLVLGPTIGSGTKDALANAMGNISAYVDYGNMHYYKAWGESYSFGYPGWDLQSMINIHKVMFGAKPFMATEGSYSSAINADAGISETLNAKYTLRYYLEYWRLGVVRTFKYELFDQGSNNTLLEDKFGLIQNNGTTIKDAGLALKNMISILNEPNPSTSFNAGTLNYSITNADSYTHSVLIQKSTGKFYLVIWNDAMSWDSDTKTEIANNDALTISFNQTVYEAKLYAPCTNGTSVVSTIVNPTSINVTIPNHPYIYEITLGTGGSSSSKLTGTVIGTTGSWNNSGNTRDKAFDGNTTTFFDASSANGNWTGLNLGANYQINTIKYYPRAGLEGRMNGGKFQASANANFSSGVVDLYTISSNPPLAWTTITITNTTGYRYVRYLSPNGGYGNVAEIEFYGTLKSAEDTEAINETNAIDANKTSDILIYPNPATSVLNITNVPINSQLNIYSIEGKVVRSEIINSNNLNINVEGWNKGIYILSIQTITNNVISKVIVK